MDNRALEEKVKALDVIADVFHEHTEKDKRRLKGYMFDSLVYRYKLARHRMTEMQIVEERNSIKHSYDPDHYFRMEERDVMRFIEILDEAIGEHD